MASHDYDIDVRTGFLPPKPPLDRLPDKYKAWETILEDATTQRLKFGERSDLSTQDKVDSETWRFKVKQMSILGIDGLEHSEVSLRRAHLVLSFILHFYVHTYPPAPASSPIYIPTSLSIPLLQVSSRLELPPVQTYSDNALYNWSISSPQDAPFSIDPSSMHSQTTFTGTLDEEHFYLTPVRIELVGASAISLIRCIQNEVFLGNLLSLSRISGYLTQLANVIDNMTAILNDMRKRCDPAIFFEKVRPWLRGQGDRRWIFEGLEEAKVSEPTELSGSSAAQSSIIHALHIFLGIDQFSDTTRNSAENDKEISFLERMQAYMPRRHRDFLDHLKCNSPHLRDIVAVDVHTVSVEEREIRQRLKDVYNTSILALKGFRDAHIRVTTLYIINQARREDIRQVPEMDETQRGARGTGGADLVPFLKGVRDRTAAAVLKD